MDRFLKRTKHHVLPVLPAPKKPKVSFKQDVIAAPFRVQEFGLSFDESVGKFFCKSCNLVIDHFGRFLLVRSYRKNYQTYLMKKYSSSFPTQKIYIIKKKFTALLPHISQIFAALEPHYLPTLPHTCRTLSSLRYGLHRTIYEILPHLIVASDWVEYVHHASHPRPAPPPRRLLSQPTPQESRETTTMQCGVWSTGTGEC